MSPIGDTLRVFEKFAPGLLAERRLVSPCWGDSDRHKVIFSATMMGSLYCSVWHANTFDLLSQFSIWVFKILCGLWPSVDRAKSADSNATPSTRLSCSRKHAGDGRPMNWNPLSVPQSVNQCNRFVAHTIVASESFIGRQVQALL
jgi:hypothetical protein